MEPIPPVIRETVAIVAWTFWWPSVAGVFLLLALKWPFLVTDFFGVLTVGPVLAIWRGRDREGPPQPGRAGRRRDGGPGGADGDRHGPGPAHVARAAASPDSRPGHRYGPARVRAPQACQAGRHVNRLRYGPRGFLGCAGRDRAKSGISG